MASKRLKGVNFIGSGFKRIPSGSHVCCHISSFSGSIFKILTCIKMYVKNAKRWWNLHVPVFFRSGATGLQRVIGWAERKWNIELCQMSVHLNGHLSVGAYILPGFYLTSTSTLYFAFHCLNVSVFPCVCWSVCLFVFLLSMAIDLQLMCDGATDGWIDGWTDGRTQFPIGSQ